MKKASCPGKVLIVGGYLILDPEFQGLSLATSARFYCTVEDDEMRRDQLGKITVISPQFKDAEWQFNILENRVENVDDKGNNPFVFNALLFVVNYITWKYSQNEQVLQRLKKSIKLTLKADNDFYSQREALTKLNLVLNYTTLSQLPKQNVLDKPIHLAHKTGLGSSACLVTSIVTALLSFYLNSESEALHNQAHVLSQLAHCKAQGKIGSGFDVASAAFGSCIYRRFDPNVIRDVMDNEVWFKNKDWIDLVDENLVKPYCRAIQLPHRLHLALFEVDTGSNTPSMVSKLLKWKNENKEQSNKVYSILNQANNQIIQLLEELNNLVKIDFNKYNLMMDQLMKINFVENSNTHQEEEHHIIAYKLFNSFQIIRQQFQALSYQINLPIEPVTQTQLIDQLTNFEGCLFGGVPGAGGYDAIFILYIDDSLRSNRTKLHSKLSTLDLKDVNVAPLLSEEDSHQGVIIE